MATSISYNGNSLQTSNILTSDIPHETSPLEDDKIYQLAHGNMSVVPYIAYKNRAFSVSGTLVSDNITDMDTLVDTFKSYFALSTGTYANLDIGYASSTRRYYATVNQVIITRPKGLNYAQFKVDFVTQQPFGMDTTSTSILSATGRTLALYNDNFTFGGTAPYQLPVWTVTETTVGGSPATGFVSIGNNTTGQAIVVNRTWTSGDVLVVDCYNKLVTVNGSNVAFSGAFPEFPPGSQTLNYTDNFSSRTFSISVVYTKLYL